MLVGHMLDHVLDHVLDHMIIGFVTTALHHLATNLDLFTISGLCIIKRDYFPIKDQWKSFDIDVLKVDLTVFSQPSSYHFTHSSPGGIMSISFCTQLLDI